MERNSLLSRCHTTGDEAVWSAPDHVIASPGRVASYLARKTVGLSSPDQTLHTGDSYQRHARSESVKITSPRGGTVRQKHMVTGSFSGLQAGDNIFVVVRNRFGQLYPQSFPFTASAENGEWRVVAFFGDPGRNVGETFELFAVVSQDAALTNQLIAIGQSGGTTALPFDRRQSVTVVRQ